MVEYRCEKCNRVFNHRTRYTRHINRKKSCSDQIGTRNGDDFKCKGCGKEYTTYSALHRHTKSCASMQVTNNNTQVNVITNNLDQSKTINNNQVQVDGDVKVVKFGDENLSYISDDLFKHILGRGFKAVTEFIEHSHFNKEHPENHNIYIANIKTGYVVMYDGDKWTINKKDDVMEDIIYAKSDLLNLKFKELMNQMDERDIAKFKNFINKRDDDATMNRLKEELRMQLYNNRYLAQESRKNSKRSAKGKSDDPLQIGDKEQKEKLSNIVAMLEHMDGNKLDKMQRLLNSL